MTDHIQAEPPRPEPTPRKEAVAHELGSDDVTRFRNKTVSPFLVLAAGAVLTVVLSALATIIPGVQYLSILAWHILSFRNHPDVATVVKIILIQTGIYSCVGVILLFATTPRRRSEVLVWSTGFYFLAWLVLAAGTWSPYEGTVVVQERVSLSADQGRVRSLCFSPDGAKLVAGGENGGITIWDTATWKLEATILEPGEASVAVLCVAYSPNGEMLAAAKGNGTAKLYDGACNELMALQAGIRWVRCVAFSPDGKQLASAADDGSLILWDMASGKASARLEGSGEAVFCVAFSPDGKSLASGGWEQGVVRTWDLESRREVQRLSIRSVPWCVAFSPDGETVATGGDFVWLHDPVTGREKATPQGHVAGSASIAIAANGQHLVSAGGAGDVKVWDLTTGRVRATYWGRPREILWSVAVSPDGKTIASGSEKGTIKIWDMVK